MRKSILITLLLAFVYNGLIAQTIEEVRDLASKNLWEKAKDAVDRYITVNPTKGDGWYIKSVIYNALAKQNVLLGKNKGELINLLGNPASSSKTTRNNIPYELLLFQEKKIQVYIDASGKVAEVTELNGMTIADYNPNSTSLRMDAFNAYKKYLELDPKAFEGTLNQHATLFDVAFGYLGRASEDFNAKRFEDALDAFKSAEIVENYIVQKGFSYPPFTFPAFDTQLYINVAAAAVNAKRQDVAVQYYQKMADQKIVGQGYEEIYKYLVDQFSKKGDKANRDKYLAIGKTLYPDDEYWCQAKSQAALSEAGDDKKKLFAKYEELINGSCNTFVNNYNYAVQLYNYAFTLEKRPDDFAVIQAKLAEQLKRTIAIHSTSEANMLMCRYQFALISDLDNAYNAIKDAKPDDLKKKADLTLQISKKYDEALPYAMTVYNMLDAKSSTLEPGEKGNFKIVCSMLAEYWDKKDDKVKVKQYQDKMASIQ